MSPNTSGTSGSIPDRSRRGLLRRGRARWTCPDCGLSTSDPVAVRLGFCSPCNDFTGMCGAGRKIICRDMMSVTAWHNPCTSLGTAAWEIIQINQETQGTSQQVALLCPAHDAQLRNGRAPWISRAVPLDDANWANDNRSLGSRALHSGSERDVRARRR
jgi:hypothetical protein